MRPLPALLPDFKIPTHGSKQITLEEIGTQHSGLPRLPTNFAPADEANPYADYDVAKLKAFLAEYSLTRDPGAAYEYSNLAFGLLGVALAQQAHISYEKLVADRILRPLQMTMSGIEFSDAMRAHLATAHGEDGKPTKNWDITALASASAIRSSTNDMLRYLKANMHPDNSAFGAAMKFAQTRDAIWQATAYRSGLDDQAERKIQRDLAQRRHRRLSQLPWLQRRRQARHHRDDEYCQQCRRHRHGRADRRYADRLIAQRRWLWMQARSTTTPGRLQTCREILINIARKDDQLYAQATGQGAFPIYPSGKDEFFANVSGISISFVRDAKGKVASLILHQNGDRPAPKLAANEVAAPATTKSIELDTARRCAGYIQANINSRRTSCSTSRREGRPALRAQLTGQSEYAVYASARDKFFYTVVDAQLEFTRDKNGKVDALILHQNGQSPRAARIAP